MATILPFRALRPVPERAAEVAAVPYDVVSTEEARELARENPWSFLHVSRAEIDLPAGTDPYSPDVYRAAASSFDQLKRLCPFLEEAEPSLYLYRLRLGSHEQIGVAGIVSLAEYDAGVIRKHERTRPDKEEDRTRHMVALRAQTGPVFLTYRDRADVDELVAAAVASDPVYDFFAEDGVEHTLWRVEPAASARLSAAFEAAPLLYIADGHHRAASASRARDAFAERADRAGGSAEYDYFLAVAFPARQLRILPYNRIVRDLGGRSPEEFLAALEEKVRVRKDAGSSPTRRGEFTFYLGGRWYGASFDGGGTDELDVTRLQDAVLEPVLGIRDVRTDPRIDFVGGIRGTAALEKAVDEGRAAVAFSLYPVSIEDLMRISDADEIMPPKSTWFEPKLRDGLLIHEV